MASRSPKGPVIMRASLDDIERGIMLGREKYDISRQPSPELEKTKEEEERPAYLKPRARKPQSPYIKITLRKTADILLFEQRSETALRESDDGRAVHEDNERYEYLTVGKGSVRLRHNAEAQTSVVVRKSRDVNTECILRGHVASYVSNFEMFDTYKDLEASTRSVDMDGKQTMDVTTYTMHGVDTFIAINRKPSFKLALMLTMRILAGNVYEAQQRRFRNMLTPDPLAPVVNYCYRLDLLWRYKLPPSPQSAASEESSAEAGREQRMAVADLSWCPANGDILAVAYGIYSYWDARLPSEGRVCIWNIKNPVNPERLYSYAAPVSAVEFSSFSPHLLAVGLNNGDVEVRNIVSPDMPPIAISQRCTSPGYETITALKWQPLNDDDDGESRSPVESVLALSKDGSVTQYRLINSPHLLGKRMIWLDRVEDSLDGDASVQHSWMQANRHPEGLYLCLHPRLADLYYVLTDEGCLHTCSTNYPQQHLDVRQLHEAGINMMDFSPWSPFLFLTCGNDWCIHIWMEDVQRPIITLQTKTGPIHCASWSKTHSTVVVSLNRHSVDVWDIRRSTLKPVSSTNIDKSIYTLFKLNLCGRSMAVGNEHGEVLMLAFEDMPFPPYFQYEQLKAAIFNAIATDHDLTKQLKSKGYFGYPEHKRTKKPKKQKRRA